MRPDVDRACCLDGNGHGVVDLCCGHVGAVAGEYRGGDQLGEMVGAAGFPACEVGAVVLLDNGLAVDGDERMDGERGEVGIAGELTLLPGVMLAAVVMTVKIDVHGVFLGFTFG